MDDRPCYFVTGNDRLGFCQCAGHYLADCPQAAIKLFIDAQDSNPHVAKDWAEGLTFKAKRSKSRHNAMNA